MGLLPLLALYAALMVRIGPELGELLARSDGLSEGALVERVQAMIVQALSGDWYETAVSLLTVGGALLSLIPFRLYARKRAASLDFAPERAGIRQALSLTLMAMSVNLLASFANVPVEWLFNRLGYSLLWEVPLGGTRAARWIMLSYVAAVGPLLEEILFRGYLMGGLRRYGDRFAVIASATLFALMHGNLSQFPGALLIGLLLGYARIKSGSLLLCVAAHMGNNLLALAMDELTGLAGDYAGLAGWASALVLMAAGLPLLVRYGRRNGPLDDPDEGGQALAGATRTRGASTTTLCWGAGSFVRAQRASRSRLPPAVVTFASAWRA